MFLCCQYKWKNFQGETIRSKTENKLITSMDKYSVQSQHKPEPVVNSLLWPEIILNNRVSVEKSGRVVIIKPIIGQESNSTASKTSDEKFRLTKTLFSIASALSSRQTLSRLMRLLSDVGLMTIMRGTL